MGQSDSRPGFMRAVLRRFSRHRGILLAGAIAYYFLLSVLPLTILVFVGLANLLGEDEVLHILSVQFELALTAGVEPMIETVRAAFDARGGIGWLGIVVLIFISTAIFRVLEETMCVVFEVEREMRVDNQLVSVFKHFVLVSLVLLGMLVLTAGTSFLQALSSDSWLAREHPILQGNMLLWSLYGASFAGHVLLFAAIYKVLPPVKIPKGMALAGGAISAVAWEACRAALTWYFESLSLVNVVYGSLGTAVVLLFGFELVAVILLFGAEFIAERMARNENDGFQ